MSMQNRFTITWGSSENGMAVEKRMRDAALVEGQELPAWVKSTLAKRADEVLGKQKVSQEKDSKR